MRYDDKAERMLPLEHRAPLIRQTLATRARGGLIFDFDGTLAPIVSRPEHARMIEGARMALRSLAQQYGLVAIVSGRSVDDLARRVDAPGIWLVGSHGAVLRAPNGEEERLALDRARLDAIQAFELDQSGGLEAVRPERKGTAIAYHYRGLEHNLALIQELRVRARQAAERADLTVSEGRCVVEVRIPGIDKGAAFRRLVDRRALAATVVAGDDWTDLDLFRAARAHPACVSVAIAVRSGEMPPPLLAEADFVAEGVHPFVDWLVRLAAPIDASRRTPH